MSGRPLVTTARHPRVRQARRLAKRAFRRSDGKFLVEGPTGVAEALAEPGALLEVFVTPEAAARHVDLLAAVETAGVPVHDVTADVMAELAQTVTPPGVVGVAASRHRDVADVFAGSRLVVLLASVRDPGNAGTILRTADALGADGAVFTDASVDPYNPKCARAAAGSLFHLPFAIDVPIADAVAAARGAGMQILATSTTGSVTLPDAALTRPTAWLLGNEAWGLPDELLGLADETVRIPAPGRAESLNLATAAAICIYASSRALHPGG